MKSLSEYRVNEAPLLAHRVKRSGDLEVRTSSGWLVIGRVERRGEWFAAFHADGQQINEAFKRRSDAVLALLQAWGMFRKETQ